MIPVVDETVRPAGIGTYGIGCVPELDTETMTLVIGPGVMRILREDNELREEFIFPGGEAVLPPETTEVWIGKKRADGKPLIIVNCGKGVDDVTYEPIHVILRLGDVGWILSHWRCTKMDLPRWAQSKYRVPPDPEQFRGDNAEVVLIMDFPPHLRASIEREKMAEEAALRLGVLIRKQEQWTDTEKEQALRDLIMACPDVDLPPEMLERS
jgi:hypothetical protein